MNNFSHVCSFKSICVFFLLVFCFALFSQRNMNYSATTSIDIDSRKCNDATVSCVGQNEIIADLTGWPICCCNDNNDDWISASNGWSVLRYMWHQTPFTSSVHFKKKILKSSTTYSSTIPATENSMALLRECGTQWKRILIPGVAESPLGRLYTMTSWFRYCQYHQYNGLA